MDVKGGYDTKDHEKPKFDLDLALGNMDFQKAFNTMSFTNNLSLLPLIIVL